MATYYELLNIPHDADEAAIRRAYEEQRQQYDVQRLGAAPDLTAVARQRLEELERAYQTLLDPASRQAYDATLVRSARRGLTRRELLFSLGGALIALLLLGLLFSSVSNQEALPPLAAVNKPAPAFELPALGGGQVRLSDYRGKVVLVNFWATWCGPCEEEAPDLAAAYRKLHADGLVIIGVNLRDQESSDGIVAAFAKRYNLPFPIALDREGAVARAFQIYPIPVTYFIDSEGMIRYIRNGTVTQEEIERTFRELQRSAPSAALQSSP